MEHYLPEALRQACHGYIGSPLKDRYGRVLGTGIKTRIRKRVLYVTYETNLLGYEEFGKEEIEVAAMRADD